MKPSEADPIDVIRITRESPFVLVVNGIIRKAIGSDSIIFDFGLLGSFRKKGPGAFLVGGYWVPINYDALGSGEYDTDTDDCDVVEAPNHRKDLR